MLHHSTTSRSGDSTGNNWTSYIIHAALRALSVPASSSPIERTVSKGAGVKPLRSKMSDARVSALMQRRLSCVTLMWQWQWAWYC